MKVIIEVEVSSVKGDLSIIPAGTYVDISAGSFSISGQLNQLNIEHPPLWEQPTVYASPDWYTSAAELKSSMTVAAENLKKLTATLEGKFDKGGAINGPEVVRILMDAIPGVDKIWIDGCPATYGLSCTHSWGMGAHQLLDVVVHLNDRHKWPREQIASWLDTLPYDLTLNQHPKENS